jgi:hypothetical protein
VTACTPLAFLTGLADAFFRRGGLSLTFGMGCGVVAIRGQEHASTNHDAMMTFIGEGDCVNGKDGCLEYMGRFYKP